MGSIVMKKGEAMPLKITSIVPNVKQVKKGDTIYQRHDIHMEDKQGNTLRGEFLNQSMTPDGFHIGIIQYVRCLWWDDKGPTIEPYDPAVIAEPIVQSLPKQNVEIPNANQERQPVAQHAIAGDANVGGKAIVFAMAYAKDILVAEIGRKKPGYVATDEDIERMISNAKKIRMGLLDFDAY